MGQGKGGFDEQLAKEMTEKIFSMCYHLLEEEDLSSDEGLAGVDTLKASTIIDMFTHDMMKFSDLRSHLKHRPTNLRTFKHTASKLGSSMRFRKGLPVRMGPPALQRPQRPQLRC